MLPQATTGALLCGLLALYVGLTHASIAAAFESTPSSSFDHGGDSIFSLFSPSDQFLPGFAAATDAAVPYILLRL